MKEISLKYKATCTAEDGQSADGIQKYCPKAARQNTEMNDILNKSRKTMQVLPEPLEQKQPNSTLGILSQPMSQISRISETLTEASSEGRNGCTADESTLHHNSLSKLCSRIKNDKEQLEQERNRMKKLKELLIQIELVIKKASDRERILQMAVASNNQALQSEQRESMEEVQRLREEEEDKRRKEQEIREKPRKTAEAAERLMMQQSKSLEKEIKNRKASAAKFRDYFTRGNIQPVNIEPQQLTSRKISNNRQTFSEDEI